MHPLQASKQTQRKYWREGAKFYAHQFDDSKRCDEGKVLSEIVSVLEQRVLDKVEKKGVRGLVDSELSVYEGAAGVAYYLLRVCRKDKNLLRVCESILSQMDTKQLSRPISFIMGESGVFALRAVVAHLKGEDAKRDENIDRVLSIKVDDARIPDELLYGRAGYLYSLLFILRHTSNSKREAAVKQAAHAIFDRILLSGLALRAKETAACTSPLLYEWHDTRYIGAAHGISGILYMLLDPFFKERWASDSPLLSESVTSKFKDPRQVRSLLSLTASYLASLRFDNGNYPTADERDYADLVQWCHGAPAFALFFCRAYESLGEARFLDLAKQAGEHVWTHGFITKGPGLCHGLGGNGYCMLALYKTTKEEKYLNRAWRFAEFALMPTPPPPPLPSMVKLDAISKKNVKLWLDEAQDPLLWGLPDFPYSLGNGILGLCSFLHDLLEPSNASFPFYDL